MASSDSASRDHSGDKASKTTSPTRNASQLEADVTATRHRLAASVEALIDEVHPNRIKQRYVEKAKRFADTEIETAKALVFNARGDLRTDRVVLLGAAVVGGIAFLVIVRALATRGRGD